MPVVTREDKGSPLTHEEMDANFLLSSSELGEWNEEVQYQANDLTVYDGVIYRSLTTNTNKVPPTNGSDWTVYTGSTGSSVLVVTEADHDALAANAGRYHRHTASGAKTITFGGAETYAAGMTFVISNRADAGNLTLTEDGVTLNAPGGGGSVIKTGYTATVRFISATEADISGDAITPVE